MPTGSQTPSECPPGRQHKLGPIFCLHNMGASSGAWSVRQPDSTWLTAWFESQRRTEHTCVPTTSEKEGWKRRGVVWSPP